MEERVWKLEIHDVDDPDDYQTIKVTAGHWMQALERGREQLGEEGAVPTGASCSVSHPGRVVVHDHRHRRVFTLTTLMEQRSSRQRTSRDSASVGTPTAPRTTNSRKSRGGKRPGSLRPSSSAIPTASASRQDAAHPNTDIASQPEEGAMTYSILSQRRHQPSEFTPLAYREVAITVDPSLAKDDLAALLRTCLDATQQDLLGVEPGQLVKIAAFSQADPDPLGTRPLATLEWKDWVGRVEVHMGRVAPAGESESIGPQVKKVSDDTTKARVDQPRRRAASFKVTQPFPAIAPPAAGTSALSPKVDPPSRSKETPPPEVGPLPKAAVAQTSAGGSGASGGREQKEKTPKSAATTASAEHQQEVAGASSDVTGTQAEEIRSVSSNASSAVPSNISNADEPDDILSDVFDSCHELSYQPTPLAGFQFAVGVLSHYIACERVTAAIYDIDADELRVVASSDRSAGNLHDTVPASRGLVQRALSSIDQTLRVDACQTEEAYAAETDSLGVHNPRNLLLARVAKGRHVLGLLHLANANKGGNAEDGFTGTDEEVVKYVAEQLGRFIDGRRKSAIPPAPHR